MSHENIPLVLYFLGFILGLALIGIHWLEQDDETSQNTPRGDQASADRLHPSL